MEMERLQYFGPHVEVRRPDLLDWAWDLVGELCGQVLSPKPPQTVPVEETFDWIGCGDYSPLVAAPVRPQPLSAPTCSPRDTVVVKQLEVPLSPVGVYNDTVIFGARGDRVPLPPPPPPPPPPPRAVNARKQRKCGGMRRDDDTPYVKKPPNAFMLFRAEQRPGVVAQLHKPDSAAVNSAVGRMWRLLSAAEQQQYYGEAERLKLLHLQFHPDWSAKDNYGKKKKRVRSKAPALH